MNMKPILIRNIALMVVFGAVGLTMFTENVRTVQILGLFASGVVFGVSLAAIISAYRSKQAKA
jgi:site-specific recombinase